MNCCKEDPDMQRPHVQPVPMVSRIAPRWSGIAVINLKMQELSSEYYLGKYLVLLFYPCNFSFVCPVELIQFNDRLDEFHALGYKNITGTIEADVVAISTDSKFSHFAWLSIPRKQGGIGELRIPLLSDKNQRISKSYGVLDKNQGTAIRALFIIDKQQVIRHITMNDDDLPRSVDEALRIVKTCCFVDKHGNICPYGPLPKVCEKTSREFFSI